MTDTSGDRQPVHETDQTDQAHRTDQPDQGPFPWRVVLAIGAIAVGYLAVVGVGMWFVVDIAEALAPVIGDDPLTQRLAGWSVWAVFLLAVALVFLRTARNWSRGTPISRASRWVTAIVLVLLSAPGFVTLGGRGGTDEETRNALQVIGRDFELGVQLGRFGAVVVVFAFLGLVFARAKAISDKSKGPVAFLRTPAYAALGVLAVTLVAAIVLQPG